MHEFFHVKQDSFKKRAWINILALNIQTVITTYIKVLSKMTSSGICIWVTFPITSFHFYYFSHIFLFACILSQAKVKVLSPCPNSTAGESRCGELLSFPTLHLPKMVLEVKHLQSKGPEPPPSGLKIINRIFSQPGEKSVMMLLVSVVKCLHRTISIKVREQGVMFNWD